jgi:hypothetical protein
VAPDRAAGVSPSGTDFRAGQRLARIRCTEVAGISTAGGARIVKRPFPPPGFERQREAIAGTAHEALLDAAIRKITAFPGHWHVMCAIAVELHGAGAERVPIRLVIDTARIRIPDKRSDKERAEGFHLSNSLGAFISRAMEDAGIVPVGFFEMAEQPSKRRRPPRKPQTPASVNSDPLRPMNRKGGA